MSDFLYADSDRRLPVFGTIELALKTFAKAPFVLVGLVLLPFVSGLFFKLLAHEAPQDIRIVFNIVDVVVQFGVQCIASAAAIFVTRNLVEDREPRAGEALTAGLSRAAALFRVSILQAVILAIGLLLLIVPGVIAMFALLIAIPACVLEGLGAIDSLKRSARLTKGNRFRLFGAILLFLLIFVALLAAVGALIATKSTVLIVVLGLALLIVFIVLAAAASTLPTIMFLQLRRLREPEFSPRA